MAVLALAVGLSAQAPPRLTLRAAAESIRAADLLRDITYLASDELAGRATPSPGQDAAAAYVEQALRAAGVTPMGEAGGYRQRYVVTRATLVPQETSLLPTGRWTRAASGCWSTRPVNFRKASRANCSARRASTIWQRPRKRAAAAPLVCS
jgi:hypothetical protein